MLNATKCLLEVESCNHFLWAWSSEEYILESGNTQMILNINKVHQEVMNIRKISSLLFFNKSFDKFIDASNYLLSSWKKCISSRRELKTLFDISIFLGQIYCGNPIHDIYANCLAIDTLLDDWLKYNQVYFLNISLEPLLL